MNTLGKSKTLWSVFHQIISTLDSLSAPNSGETIECILWPGPITNRYGKVKIDGVIKVPSRVFAEIFLEDFDPHLVVMHTCDNSPCVNPLHLVMGTASENQKDAVNKGRWANNSPWIGYISDEEVEDMKGLRQLGWTYQKIADYFDISYAAVYKRINK